MKPITYYNVTTGAIISTLTGSDFEIRANAPPNSAYVEGTYDYTRYYITGGVAVEKKTMVIQLNGNVISGLPNPTTVYVEGSQYVVTDGVFEFSSNLPGPYTIKLESPQYLTREVILP